MANPHKIPTVGNSIPADIVETHFRFHLDQAGNTVYADGAVRLHIVGADLPMQTLTECKIDTSTWLPADLMHLRAVMDRVKASLVD